MFKGELVLSQNTGGMSVKHSDDQPGSYLCYVISFDSDADVPTGNAKSEDAFHAKGE